MDLLWVVFIHWLSWMTDSLLGRIELRIRHVYVLRSLQAHRWERKDSVSAPLSYVAPACVQPVRWREALLLFGLFLSPLFPVERPAVRCVYGSWRVKHWVCWWFPFMCLKGLGEGDNGRKARCVYCSSLEQNLLSRSLSARCFNLQTGHTRSYQANATFKSLFCLLGVWTNHLHIFYLNRCFWPFEPTLNHCGV